MTTLLQSNFNTFYDFAIDYDMVGTRKFLQDYRETATSFAKKYGVVDWKNIDSAQAKHIMTDVGLNLSGQAMERFGDFAKESIKDVGLSLAAGGGPGGAAAGFFTYIAGYGLDFILDEVADWIETKEINLAPGDWCVLDETGLFQGRRRLMGGEMESSMFREVEELETMPGDKARFAPNAHLCVFMRDHATERQVFNVETGNTRMVKMEYVRRVQEKHQQELDENPQLRAYKASLEPKQTYDQLRKEVNVSVGAKVIYKDELWEVESYSNERCVITSNGQYEEVTWDALRPAFNDTTAQPLLGGVPGGFVMDAQGVHKGDWVYVYYETQKNYHLGVVQSVRGNDIRVISADQRDDDLWYKEMEIEKWIMQPATGPLGLFRMGAIEGSDNKISENRPDKLFRGIVNIPREGAEKYFMVPVESTYYEEGGTSGDARGHLGSAQVADKQWEAEAIQDEGPLRLRGGGYSRHGGELEDPPALEFGKKSDNTMLIIGGICVAGVLLYVYK